MNVISREFYVLFDFLKKLNMAASWQIYKMVIILEVNLTV